MRPPRSLLALSLVTLTVIAASACADQAQGERCDKANGDLDCASGLVCTSLSSLGDNTTTAAICCPPLGQPASSSLCSRRGTNLGDAGPSPGTGGTSGSDAGQKPASDAKAD